jgi:ATP adenylyltransferase
MPRYVKLENARYEDQRAVMEQIAASGKCPFCAEQRPSQLIMEILQEGRFWILTYNQWPRENTKVHLLFVYKDHVENMQDMDPQAGVELLEMLAWSEKKFQIVGGIFFMRFGDPEYSGATVNHLHAQLIVPAKDKPGFEPVRFKVG